MFRSASHKGERGCSKETNYLDFGLIIRKDKIPTKQSFSNVCLNQSTKSNTIPREIYLNLE